MDVHLPSPLFWTETVISSLGRQVFLDDDCDAANLLLSCPQTALYNQPQLQNAYYQSIKTISEKSTLIGLKQLALIRLGEIHAQLAHEYTTSSRRDRYTNQITHALNQFLKAETLFKNGRGFFYMSSIFFNERNLSQETVDKFCPISCNSNDREEIGFHLLKTAAKKGYVLASLHLSECYRRGLGTSKNSEKAMNVLRKLAKEGSDTALFEYITHECPWFIDPQLKPPARLSNLQELLPSLNTETTIHFSRVYWKLGCLDQAKACLDKAYQTDDVVKCIMKQEHQDQPIFVAFALSRGVIIFNHEEAKRQYALILEENAIELQKGARTLHKH